MKPAPPTSTLILLAVLVLLYSVGTGLYFARGVEPSPAFEFLFRAGLLCSVVWWIRADSRRHGLTPVYCLGMLVGVAWMIVIPYHLFRTRGVKIGLLILLALMGTSLVLLFVVLLTCGLFTPKPAQW
ncbi:MAG: hypothetical protein ACRD68_15205 [Pyrinomonadaceae bacterium]